ncbi:NAD(P)H-dependent oxidoreductase [Rhodobacter lacus]|uniref:NAD(P)H-dependent oxidoreductase n=1 Tax=Rhodobacter lacus TaxID=1641972 RepID=A0ABW5A690_9RHOB
MLIDTLTWRYATKKMDPAKAVPEEKLARILRAAQLAPTSSGIQPFEIFVVTNAETRAKLRAAAGGQSQLTDGSHVLVFAAWDNYTEARIDAVVDMMVAERGVPREMVAPYYENLKAAYLPRPANVNADHAARQAFLAFGMALAQAAEDEVDATPMEGFDPAQVDDILGLREKGLRSVTLMPLGYRAAEGDWLLGMKKVRKPLDELVTRID